MSNFLRAAASFSGSIRIMEPATSDELSLETLVLTTETFIISSLLCSKSITVGFWSDSLDYETWNVEVNFEGWSGMGLENGV